MRSVLPGAKERLDAGVQHAKSHSKSGESLARGHARLKAGAGPFQFLRYPLLPRRSRDAEMLLQDYEASWLSYPGPFEVSETVHAKWEHGVRMHLQANW
jgi:hypothetical protein